jgi:hypothetical protein
MRKASERGATARYMGGCVGPIRTLACFGRRRGRDRSNGNGWPAMLEVNVLAMEMTVLLRSNLLRKLGLARLAIPVCALMVFLPPQAVADDAPIAFGQQTNGKARAEILSLKHTEADTMTLRFAVANDNNRDLSMVLPNMQLIDLVNRRIYQPGLTSSSCRIPSGERRVCWAVFAAPNANVRTLNVKFYEDFDLIPVPLTNSN